MPITDYNKKKALEVTSQNDSGTTQDKAQPLLLRGNDFTGVDGFESGNSQLGWESDSDVSIDTNSEVYLTSSLQINSSDQSLLKSRNLSENISSDGKKASFSLKIDNQTGNSDDSVDLFFREGGFQKAGVEFRGDGDVLDGQNNVIGTWTSNNIQDVEIVFDFSNNEYDIIINDSTLASNVSFNTNTSLVDTIAIGNDSSNSSSTVNAFFDRLTYTSPVEDSVNTGGDIGIDFTNVSDAQDIAVYDQNGNLLDYEIEDLDTTAETATLWCYNSWTRDDTVQAQIAYGDNSANTDRQNVEGTWNNTGQNAVMIQHLQDDPLTATDSTANNNDGTVSGATATTGEFNGAANFDGTDDNIVVPDLGVFDQDHTVVIAGQWNQIESFHDMYHPRNERDIRFGHTDGTNIEFEWFDGSGNIIDGPAITTGETYHQVISWDDSSDATLYVDGNAEGSLSTTTPNSVTDENWIGGDSSTPDYFEGVISFLAVYSEAKSSDWQQAHYDASPKGNQIFFTQQAAETTTATIAAPETILTASNPEPTLSPGVSTVAVTPTVNTTTTPNPTVSPGTVTVTPDETLLTTVNPAPSVFAGETIFAPETTLTSNTPNPTVAPGTATINSPETVLTTANPAPAVNRQVLVGQPTKLTSSTPNPSIQAGTATVSPPETQLNSVTVNPAVIPGVSRVAVTPTSIQATALNPDLSSGSVNIQIQATQLTVRNPNPGIFLLDIVVTGNSFPVINTPDKNALITTNDKFVSMSQHTFKEGDLGDKLEATLKDDDGAISLSGVQEVRIHMEDATGTVVLDTAVTVTDASNGKIEYDWQSGDPIETAGVYKTEFEIIDGSGDPDTVPNNGYISITVERDLA